MKKQERMRATPADQGDLFGAAAAPERPKPSTQPGIPLQKVPAADEVPAPAPAPAVSAPEPTPPPAPRAAVLERAPAPVPPRPKVRPVLTVSELTAQLKGVIEDTFPRVLVRGEVSGFRGPNARGHLYFSLKDSEACLDARIWASTAQRLKFHLRDGLEVVAEGSIDLYAPQGRYSLIIQRIEPAGEGALALAFQQLKERLTAEGLMGEGRTRAPRPVPFLPRRIGVVTSRTGAALQDFLRVLHARNPKVSVLLCDARVQGDGAADEVVRAIRRLARTDVDVIVVTRGGGSLEDLWTFNEEKVARAIFQSPVPVVSAIGHEVDFTIADFVADLRCPTPSAAAERLAPVLRDLELSLRTAESRLRKAAERHVLTDRQRLARLSAKLGDPRRLIGQRRIALSEDADLLARAIRKAWKLRRERLAALSERLGRQRPQARLAQNRRALEQLRLRLVDAGWRAVEARRGAADRFEQRLGRASPSRRIHAGKAELAALAATLKELERARVGKELQRFQATAARLDAMSPLKVMGRGYSVAFRAADGRLIRRAGDVQVGDALRIRLAGSASQALAECDEIDAQVTATRPAEPPKR